MKEEYKNKGITLLKKGQKGIIHAIFSRFGLMLLMLLAQVLFLFGLFGWFQRFLPHYFGAAMLFTVIMVVYLLNSDINPTAKITWLILIMPLQHSVPDIALRINKQQYAEHRKKHD